MKSIPCAITVIDVIRIIIMRNYCADIRGVSYGTVIEHVAGPAFEVPSSCHKRDTYYRDDPRRKLDGGVLGDG